MGFRISNLLRSVGSVQLGLAAVLIGCASEEPEIPDQPAGGALHQRHERPRGGQGDRPPPRCSRKWSASTPIFLLGDPGPGDGGVLLLPDGSTTTAPIPALENFIQLHPGNRNAAYALYLRALCYYEQIADVTRDHGNHRGSAARAERRGSARFPNTPHARDASLKLDLVRDHLAGKEMEVGRYYLQRDMYLAAINRFRTVVEQHQTTTHVPEAPASPGRGLPVPRHQ